MLRVLSRTAALAVTAVLVASTAGCLGSDGQAPAPPVDPYVAQGILPPALRDNLSQPVFAIAEHREQHFMGSTGIQLYLDWVMPDAPGPLPTILGFTPYQGQDPVGMPGEADPGPGAVYNQALVEWFVPRGYVVAFADVRGNHEAGGCIDQTGPEQWQDGYDYVEWLAAQPWSNGNVGMWGASYVGETQFTTAMVQPPHLRTIVPVASVSNQYEWSFYQGIPYELQPFIGMFSYFTGSAQPSSDPDNLPYYPEKLECQGEQFAAGLDFSGDHTPFWTQRDYRPLAGQIQASVLHIHGLRDWNVRPIHIDPLFNDITAVKRGIFGQWGHAFPDREDWQLEIQTAWYDHFLLERQNGILDILPPVLIEDDGEQWWGMASFPPRQQEWFNVSLSADGALMPTCGDEHCEVKSGQLEIVDYPEEVLTDAGVLPDEQAVAGQGDLAPDTLSWSFVTDVELRLVGRPWLQFTATTDTTSTHWVAHLTVDGKTCGSQAVCDNHGYQDTRHRDGMDDPKDLQPNVPYRLRIDMYPQYDVIPAGSTVRLTLLHNDGEVQQDPTFARSFVQAGNDAVLHLPLAPPQLPLPHDTLPEVFPGYLDGSFAR